MIEERRYWGCRIDTSNIGLLWKELQEGRLRQGWGWDEGQDLRRLTVDEGASRNMRMFKEVKKGHILLVPRLPDWTEVSVVEATDDWNRGYDFSILDEDHGHIFPARHLKQFRRDGEPVTGNIRATLKNQSRFWNIDHYCDDIEKIIDADSEKLRGGITEFDRLKNIITGSAFGKVKDFGNEVFETLNREINGKEWEGIVAKILQMHYPDAVIEKVGGREEIKHGTDIRIKIPGISPGKQYVIAVQVKDYEGQVDDHAIEQIEKAEYWNADPIEKDLKLISKVIVVTRSNKEDNEKIRQKGKDNNIEFIFAEDLQKMITKYAIGYIGSSERLDELLP